MCFINLSKSGYDLNKVAVTLYRYFPFYSFHNHFFINLSNEKENAMKTTTKRKCYENQTFNLNLFKY